MKKFLVTILLLGVLAGSIACAPKKIIRTEKETGHAHDTVSHPFPPPQKQE